MLDVPDYVSVWNGYSPVPLKELNMYLCQAKLPHGAGACNYCVICVRDFTQNMKNPKK